MNITLNRKLLILCAALLIFITIYASYARDNEFTAVQWVEKGNDFQTKQKFDSAIVAYSKALDLDPQMREVYTRRGQAYISAKQYDSAIEDFTKGIELEPLNGELYWLRGVAYAGKGQHQSAIDEYSKTIRVNPKMVMAYWNSALSYEKLKLNHLAVQSYQNFARFASPENPNVEMAKKRIEELGRDK